MPPDFKVKYRFFSQSEGGRETLPFQAYRCDFCYDGEDPQDGIDMIWPEFLDSQGEALPSLPNPVSMAGVAHMRIVSPALRRTIHLGKLRVGTKGYFMEGPRRVGEVEVVEILALAENAATLSD